MSAPDLDADKINQFRDSGVKKHSTILLGAGASITSGLPDWDTFVIRLLVKSGFVNEDLAKLLLARQDPLIVVESARAAFEDKWAQNLKSELYRGTTSQDPSPLHLAAVGHYLEETKTTSLVTLNFDTLLEKALENQTNESICSLTDGGEYEEKHVVHHLHGVITPSEAKDVILTLNDFTELIAERNSWQVEYLRSAVTKGALIIAGTSFRDPDLRQWLHGALKDSSHGHKALVLLARESFGVSKDQFQKLQGVLSKQWEAVGLQPILLEDHADAAQIIRELRHIHDDEYCSPQERCQAVWKSCNAQFDSLQASYVKQLSNNAKQLKESFETDKLNLSLWLSDGSGRLARWATQDRVYLNPEALRMVETGHDSPWVAGQALGADETLFKDLDASRLRRWKSVLAIPLSVTNSNLPPVSSGVLTVGLPKCASEYAAISAIWGETIAPIADTWTDILSKAPSAS